MPGAGRRGLTTRQRVSVGTMSGDYLWVWAERRGQATVLKVRGELDTVTADRFAADAARELIRAPGPVTVDLSFLDFLDCAGARVLVEVLGAVRPGRPAAVRGIQPTVARLLDLIGLDLTPRPGPAPLVYSPAGRELLAQARVTRSQSREALLEASAAMARLAATYAELAAARERRAEQEQARARRLQSLSDAARALSARYQQRAEGGTGTNPALAQAG
jgi:anti-anti-sigma factor